MSFFVTLEGPEGGGKTSQAKYLADALTQADFDVLLTREPGGTEISDQIRNVLMAIENTSMDPSTEFLLFSASRAQLVRAIIRPHLDNGGVVVSDRYFHSSWAYQGYGHRLDLNALRQITDFATDGLSPDLILLLDLPVEIGLQRRLSGGSWNRLDAYEKQFHQRVREGYRTMAEANTEDWVMFDASEPSDAVREQILNIVLRRLSQD
ncbi:MAG: dTMP kinase [Chloroflexi bacterium]|nr:dTMP kinase [Chloroflexota bacterium]